MKVKVAYTAKLEDVPELVNQLLVKMRSDLELAALKLKFNPVELEKMVHDLSVAKDSLDIVASQIDDVVNMTSGWVAAVSPQEQQEDWPSEHGPEPELTEEVYNGTAD
jgi:hypothetical protein